MELTIDELASRVGMTTRNIRAYQTRGMLPRPALRGRTAYYDEAHVERLEAIRALQAQHGMSLDEIARLIERMPDARAAELLALARTAAAGSGTGKPVIVDLDAIRAHWGEDPTPKLLERIERLGHVRRLEGGRYEIRSGELYQAAAELAHLGVPLEVVTQVNEEVWKHSDALADLFLDMFARHVKEEAELLEGVRRLGPLARESLLAIFDLALREAIARRLAPDANVR